MASLRPFDTPPVKDRLAERLGKQSNAVPKAGMEHWAGEKPQLLDLQPGPPSAAKMRLMWLSN